MADATNNVIKMRLIAGTAYGETSPVVTVPPMIYLDISMKAGTSFAVTDEHEGRAIYAVDGRFSINGDTNDTGKMLALAPDKNVSVDAAGQARAMLLSGAPIDGNRHLWWNLVSSPQEHIEQAKADWKEDRFGKIAGDNEFIPVPEK